MTENCLHTHLCIIFEIPIDKEGNKLESEQRRYVICDNCKELLPIKSMRSERIEVPLKD